MPDPGKSIRLGVAALALSAAGFGLWAGFESYTATAVQPVPGDKWTYGFGATEKTDGAPVAPGDRISPPAAVRLAIADLGVRQTGLRACFGAAAKLYPHEWDAYISLSGNVGVQGVCNSSIPVKVNRSEYTAACRTILDFRNVQGRDCSLPANQRFCGGVWKRRQAEARLCLEGVYP